MNLVLCNGEIYCKAFKSGPVSFKLLPAGVIFDNRVFRGYYSTTFIAKKGVIRNKLLYEALLNKGFEEGEKYKFEYFINGWYLQSN